MRASFAAAALAAAIVAWPTLARADSFSAISIGAHAGTLGYGITLERPLLFDLSARVETGAMTVTTNAALDGQSYVQTDRFNNILAALDWRPSGSRFRVSAGLLFGSDSVDYVARSDLGVYVINGSIYPVAAAGRVEARVNYGQPAIYLGVGTGGGVTKGLVISANVGLVIRNGSATTSASGPAASTAALQADLAALQSQLRTHVVKPAISVGLLYRP
jgi:hypothetical protein